MVNVSFLHYNLKESKQQKLLPIKREGNSGLFGDRRRRAPGQTSASGAGLLLCGSHGALHGDAADPNTVQNGTEETCHELNPADLDGSTTIKIVYDVNLRRRLRLSDIRITGTNKLTVEDILPQLKSRKASALAFIPFLGGYGRGFTSDSIAGTGSANGRISDERPGLSAGRGRCAAGYLAHPGQSDHYFPGD